MCVCVCAFQEAAETTKTEFYKLTSTLIASGKYIMILKHKLIKLRVL